MQMAVAETMVWRTADFVERLNLGALSASDDGQSVAAAPNMPVAIHIFNVSDLNASVRFVHRCTFTHTFSDARSPCTLSACCG